MHSVDVTLGTETRSDARRDIDHIAGAFSL